MEEDEGIIEESPEPPAEENEEKGEEEEKEEREVKEEKQENIPPVKAHIVCESPDGQPIDVGKDLRPGGSPLRVDVPGAGTLVLTATLQTRPKNIRCVCKSRRKGDPEDQAQAISKTLQQIMPMRRMIAQMQRKVHALCHQLHSDGLAAPPQCPPQIDYSVMPPIPRPQRELPPCCELGNQFQSSMNPSAICSGGQTQQFGFSMGGTSGFPPPDRGCMNMPQDSCHLPAVPHQHQHQQMMFPQQQCHQGIGTEVYSGSHVGVFVIPKEPNGGKDCCVTNQPPSSCKPCQDPPPPPPPPIEQDECLPCEDLGSNKPQAMPQPLPCPQPWANAELFNELVTAPKDPIRCCDHCCKQPAVSHISNMYLDLARPRGDNCGEGWKTQLDSFREERLQVREPPPTARAPPPPPATARAPPPMRHEQGGVGPTRVPMPPRSYVSDPDDDGTCCHSLCVPTCDNTANLWKIEKRAH